MAEKIPISVLILTKDEEPNIRQCLESIKWADEIFIVDSGSSDKTLEIAGEYTGEISYHPFENYSRQRNNALNNLPVNNGWVLNLDADHRVSEDLRRELFALFEKEINKDIKGFLISRRTIFMKRWIRHGGHYPTYHAVLFRKGYGFCEDRLYDQHFVVNGKVKILKGDIIDIITDSITKFIERHNRWSTLEAAEFLTGNPSEKSSAVRPDPFGNPMERRRFLRDTYNRAPLFIRAFLYFLLRYFFRLGFLDGKEGFVFHFLQGFWYRFLVDAKIYEIRRKTEKS
ncbi:MAG: glycosyltransferase family 2 protein [Candidatus Omnitrophota bacterium]